MIDYDDTTIESIAQDYERGEFADDPEITGIRRSRQQQEDIDRKARPRHRDTRASLGESAFVQQGIRPLDGRTIADIELEGYAQSVGYRAERWTGPLGPMAIPCVRDNPTTYKALIEAWEKNPTGYLAELKRRGLVR